MSNIMAHERSIAPATLAGVRISRLRSEAWAIWNASYHSSFPDAYRMLSRSLYQEALHAEINTLFAELDRQNRELDAVLAAREPTGIEPTPAAA